jgi:chromosome segregation ATPase
MFSSKRERSGVDLLPNSDEAFAERLDMLASTVSSTAAAIAKTDGEIANVRRELGNGLARIEELTAELRSRGRASDVRELEKKVNALAFERSRPSGGKALDDLRSQVGVLAERVDTLASTVANAAASVAGRDGEIAALRRQVGEGPRGPAVDEALRRRVEDAAAAAASASLRVESYGDHIAELAERLEGLEAQLAGLVERVGTEERERMSLAAAISDAEAARGREVELVLASLAERLGAGEQRGATVASELTQVTSLWPAALRSLETRVDELAGAAAPGAGIEAGAPESPGLLGAIRALEERMQRADESAREERETVLDRLEMLSSQLDRRLEPAPVADEVVRFGVQH